ncbi:MAG: acyl carrier protein [Gammaproteobacteria bacterium]|nr:acyl carrier protein [Gammaproteobacteria bacterium]MYD75990.1 acyl carrier protein [Gammaproteobacteria bacterium]MYJ52870.1 acyl carrier protein [Gammaproteobacteria bacterium]
MSSVEKRIGDLVEKHLGISDRSLLDSNVSELGVSSMDSVNFLKVVNQEFGTSIAPEVAAGFTRLRDLITHLEG